VARVAKNYKTCAHCLQTVRSSNAEEKCNELTVLEAYRPGAI